MNILDTILNAQNGGTVRQIGQMVGLEKDQTTTALAALLPALAAGFQRNLQGSGGAGALTAALAQGNHGRYLETPSVLGDASSLADGNGILSHVFGSKDVSRQVAARAATQTGIDPAILKKMLPLAAALMMGSFARQQSAGAAPVGASAASGSDFMSMLTPLMDANRDGSMLDDVTGMLGRFFRGSH
jgi:hypothetical protein